MLKYLFPLCLFLFYSFICVIFYALSILIEYMVPVNILDTICYQIFFSKSYALKKTQHYLYLFQEHF